MPAKLLRKCDICKRWGAPFLVNDPLRGKLYLCYDCAKKRMSPNPPPPQKPA
jgi:hypothetical protein